MSSEKYFQNKKEKLDNSVEKLQFLTFSDLVENNESDRNLVNSNDDSSDFGVNGFGQNNSDDFRISDNTHASNTSSCYTHTMMLLGHCVIMCGLDLIGFCGQI